jgi:uncharacterized protein YndB with AHSA1/START domain
VDARTENRSALTLTMPSDREIVLTRVFDAPRRLVFEAWTKPEHVARWYGCRGSTLSVCNIDLRVGGAYRFVLRAPDGKDYAISGVYRDIVPPERLVYTERLNDDPNKEALIAFTLEERDGQTTMTSIALYRTAEDRDTVLKMGVETGAAQAMDRLAEVLRTMA